MSISSGFRVNKLDYNSLSEDSIDILDLANFDDIVNIDFESLSDDEQDDAILKAYERYDNDSFAGTWNYISTNCYTTKDGHDTAIALFRNAGNKCIYPVFFDADLMPYIEELSLSGHIDANCTIAPHVRHHVAGWKQNLNLWFFEFMLKHNLQSYYRELDHINLNHFDNTSLNLRNVTHRENMLNRPSMGFYRAAGGYFGIAKSNIKCSTEFEVICERAEVDNYTRAHSEDGKYLFDFLKYRKHDNALLYDYYRGRISVEEATYKYVMQFADNAWVYYRYNLQEYFKDNHIPVPEFDLGTDGLMYSRGSHILLNPFYDSDYFSDMLSIDKPFRVSNSFYSANSDYFECRGRHREFIRTLLEPFKYLDRCSHNYYNNMNELFNDLGKIRGRTSRTKNQFFPSGYVLLLFLEDYRKNPQIIDFLLRADNICFADYYTSIDFLITFRDIYNCDYREFIVDKFYD